MTTGAPPGPAPAMMSANPSWLTSPAAARPGGRDDVGDSVSIHVARRHPHAAFELSAEGQKAELELTGLGVIHVHLGRAAGVGPDRDDGVQRADGDRSPRAATAMRAM